GNESTSKRRHFGRCQRAKLVASVSWLDDGQDGCAKLTKRWPNHAPRPRPSGKRWRNRKRPAQSLRPSSEPARWQAIFLCSRSPFHLIQTEILTSHWP